MNIRTLSIFIHILKNFIHMTSQYKENNFSTESTLASTVKDKNYINKTGRPNIDQLIKRVLVERRRELRNNIITIGFLFLSIFLIFIYF